MSNAMLRFHIPATHPAFAGHFPGNPIVPGVVLLDEATHALAMAHGLLGRCCEVKSVKFLSPVGPDTLLTIQYEPLAGDGFRFDVLDEARKVASATVVFPGPPK